MIDLKPGAEYKITNREDPSWVIEGVKYADDNDNGKPTFYGHGGNQQFTWEDLESRWIVEEA